MVCRVSVLVHTAVVYKEERDTHSLPYIPPPPLMLLTVRDILKHTQKYVSTVLLYTNQRCLPLGIFSISKYIFYDWRETTVSLMMFAENMMIKDIDGEKYLLIVFKKIS